jgi:hypothetical protein
MAYPPSHNPQQPYGQPYGQQPPPPVSGPAAPHGYCPPQPPRKRTKPWVWILAGVGVIFALCLVVGAINNLTGGTSTTSTSAADDEADPAQTATKAKPAPKTSRLPGFGDPVRDGKFEFVVSGMDCSKTTLGNEYLHSKAQGRFCVMSVSVKNIGDEPQTFSGTTQKAFDVAGAQFENDGEAEFYANDDNQTFLNTINPGNKVRGKIVFDVPRAAVLTTLELHDSFFSNGVKVALK